MTVRLLALSAVLGCTPTQNAPMPPAAPAETAASAPRPKAPIVRVTDPQGLADFLPAQLDRRTPIERAVGADRASATWAGADRTITVTLSRIDDLDATRSALELLGLDVVATMDGHDLRGLRFQGNPAQVRWQLEPPNRATLDVVAVSTYHVVVTVQPATSLDDALAIGEQLDIGGLTLLALAEHKARAAPAPTTSQAPNTKQATKAPPEEPR